jgi:hypothetical protein
MFNAIVKQIGEFIAGNTAASKEPVIVVNFGRVAIIGDPMQGN